MGWLQTCRMTIHYSDRKGHDWRGTKMVKAHWVILVTQPVMSYFTSKIAHEIPLEQISNCEQLESEPRCHQPLQVLSSTVRFLV